MFLGYRITDKGETIDDSRVKALEEYPKPKATREVKQFLGLAGYYRQFIPNFAEIAEPLNRLTRKNVKFQWTAEADLAFKKFINIISYYNPPNRSNELDYDLFEYLDKLKEDYLHILEEKKHLEVQLEENHRGFN